MEQGVRLNKYISDSGFCSRRQADLLIEQGRVTINGGDVLESCLVVEGDKVAVDGELLRARKRAVYIALNKPVGVTCTVDPEDKTNIASFVNYKERIYPIGRLDKPSQGLIFLTNDGDIVNKILRAGNNHEKEYIVTVDKPVSEEFLKKMASGVRLDANERTLPCRVVRDGEMRFRVVLTQGLNRQIRRMCEVLHYNVTKLNRIRVMNVTLKGLDVGQWRFLTQTEVDKINEMVKDSSNTHEVVAEKKTGKSSSRQPRTGAKETSERAPRAAKEESGRAKRSFGKGDQKGGGSTGGSSSKGDTRGDAKGGARGDANGDTRGNAKGGARGGDKVDAKRGAKDVSKSSSPAKKGLAKNSVKGVEKGSVKGAKPQKSDAKAAVRVSKPRSTKLEVTVGWDEPTPDTRPNPVGKVRRTLKTEYEKYRFRGKKR